MAILENSSDREIISRSDALFYNANPDAAVALLNHFISSRKTNNETASSSDLFLHRLKLQTDAIMLYNWDDELIQSQIEELLSNSQTNDQPLNLATLHDLLGMVHYYRQMNMDEKDFSTAKSHLLRGFNLRQELDLPRELGISQFHLGLVDQFSGDTENAMERFETAHRHAKQSRDTVLQSFTSRHLAFLHVQSENFETALPLFELSLKLREELGMNIYVPFSYQTLGDCLKHLEKYEKALSAYLAGLKIAEKLELVRAQALLHLSLGIFYANQNKPSTSKSHYVSARDYASQIDHQGIIKYVNEQLDH